MLSLRGGQYWASYPTVHLTCSVVSMFPSFNIRLHSIVIFSIPDIPMGVDQVEHVWEHFIHDRPVSGASAAVAAACGWRAPLIRHPGASSHSRGQPPGHPHIAGHRHGDRHRARCEGSLGRRQAAGVRLTRHTLRRTRHAWRELQIEAPRRSSPRPPPGSAPGSAGAGPEGGPVGGRARSLGRCGVQQRLHPSARLPRLTRLTA